jgi:TM2 domain-containing membrane protein YozV
MPTTHKNKTLATLLATLLGGLGIHRFYLRGAKDRWAWVHLSSVPLSLLAMTIGAGRPQLFLLTPLILSALAGIIEALVLGLTPDEQWDAAYNPGSGSQSSSNWLLALLLVFTLGIGATALIAAIARTFDLLFTGGAYG